MQNLKKLSEYEKAAIIGYYRQCQNVLMIMGILQLDKETIENVLEDYFGDKLSQPKPSL